MKKDVSSLILGAAVGWIAARTIKGIREKWMGWTCCRKYHQGVGRDLTGISIELSDGRDYDFDENNDRITFLHFYHVGWRASQTSTPNVQWLAGWAKKHKAEFDIITICIGNPDSDDEDQLQDEIVANYHHKIAFVSDHEFNKSPLRKRLRMTTFPRLYTIGPNNKVVGTCHPASVYNNIEALVQ